MRIRILVGFVLLASETFQDAEQDTHNLEPIIEKLSMISRVISGIDMQMEFMNKLHGPYSYFADFMGFEREEIMDNNIVPELLKVKVGVLSADLNAALKVVKALPNESFDVSSEWLKAVDVDQFRSDESQNLTKLLSSWKNGTRFNLKFYTEHKVINIRFKYLITLLEDQIEIVSDTQSRLADWNNHERFLIRDLGVLDLAAEEHLRRVNESSETILRLSKLAKEYSNHFQVLSTLFQTLKGLNTSDLNVTIERIQQSEIKNETFETLFNWFSSNTPRIKSAGFLEGVEDIKEVFNDLNNTWLRKVLVSGKDMQMLATQLDPLHKYHEAMLPMEKSWREVRHNSDAEEFIRQMSNILTRGRTLKPEKLFESLSRSAECIPDLTKLGQSDVLELIDEFSKKVDLFRTELMKLGAVILDYYNDETALSILKFYSLTSIDTTYTLDMDKVYYITTRLQHYFRDVPAIKKFANDYIKRLKEIDSKFLSEQSIVMAKMFPIQEELKKIGLLTAVECLRNTDFDFSAAEDFFVYTQAWDVLVNLSDSTGMTTFFTAMDALNSADAETATVYRKVHSQIRQDPPRPDAEKLGVGLRVLRQVEAMYTHRDSLLAATRLSQDTVAEVHKIPGMKDVLGKKNMDGLVKLIEDVDTVNRKAATLDTRNLTKLWNVFYDAQNIVGVPMDYGKVAAAVMAASNATPGFDSKAIEEAFTGIPQSLDLDFASYQKTSLNDAFETLPSIIKYFHTVFDVRPPTTTTTPLPTFLPSSTPTTTLPSSTTPSSPLYIVYYLFFILLQTRSP